MDEPVRKNKAIKEKRGEPSLSSEVDELVGAQAKGETEFFNDDKPISDDDFSAARAAKKRRVSAGAVIGRVLLILALLAVAAAVAIMEPWVPPDEELETDPAVEKLAPRTVAVGETYKIDVPLGSNERVDEITVSDSTLLALSDGGVTGLGEYFEPVILKIVTMEKEIPQSEPKHRFAIGVRDYSVPLDNIRSWLRDVVGVEKKKPQRTELAVLHRYEQAITVGGLELVTEESAYALETYLGGTSGIELELAEGTTLKVASQNDKTAAVSFAATAGRAVLSVSGGAAGKTKAVVDYGFYKEVDDETFARWLEWDAFPAAQEGGDDASEETASSQSADGTRIFIPTRRLILPVTVTDLDEPVVSTELNATDIKTASDYANGYVSALADGALALVNEARSAEGLAALTASDALADLADERVKALADSFAASTPEGAADELIGGGYETARAAVDAWLALPETRAALLSESATAFGCSLWRSDGAGFENYWCAETA